MATEKTTNLNWDKPVFPSDNIANELDALIDQIDVSVNDADGGSSWTVSDGGTEIAALPDDLNFGTGISVTDDGDGSVTIEGSNQYTDSEAVSAINNDTDHGATAQHDYYTDSDAVSAIETTTLSNLVVSQDSNNNLTSIEGHKIEIHDHISGQYGYTAFFNGNGDRGGYIGHGDGGNYIDINLDNASVLDISGGGLRLEGSIDMQDGVSGTNIDSVDNLNVGSIDSNNGSAPVEATQQINFQTGASFGAFEVVENAATNSLDFNYTG